MFSKRGMKLSLWSLPVLPAPFAADPAGGREVPRSWLDMAARSPEPAVLGRLRYQCENTKGMEYRVLFVDSLEVLDGTEMK